MATLRQINNYIRECEKNLKIHFGLDIKLEPHCKSGRLNIPVETILDIIEEETKISKKDITSKVRKSKLVDARHLTMYFLREYSKISYPEIKNKLKRKNHTTVLHAKKNIENKISVKDPFIYPLFSKVEEKLLNIQL